jgi:hypothetical protein
VAWTPVEQVAHIDALGLDVPGLCTLFGRFSFDIDTDIGTVACESFGQWVLAHLDDEDTETISAFLEIFRYLVHADPSTRCIGEGSVIERVLGLATDRPFELRSLSQHLCFDVLARGPGDGVCAHSFQVIRVGSTACAVGLSDYGTVDQIKGMISTVIVAVNLVAADKPDIPTEVQDDLDVLNSPEDWLNPPEEDPLVETIRALTHSMDGLSAALDRMMFW